MRVLITRAEPAADRTATKLKSLGFSPVCLPLFELETLDFDMPESAYDGFIFTSSNAVETFGGRDWKNEHPGAIAFCVGETTAKSAEKVGFSNLVTASGGGAKLAEKMRLEHELAGKRLLFPTTPDRSFDMVAALREMVVEEIHIYRAKKLEPNQAIFSEVLKSCADGAVLSYSAMSAAHLDELVSRFGLAELSKKLSHVAISTSVADELVHANWRTVLSSRHPNESSMIEQLKSLADSC